VVDVGDDREVPNVLRIQAIHYDRGGQPTPFWAYDGPCPRGARLAW
jgi:hypothetical protein